MDSDANSAAYPAGDAPGFDHGAVVYGSDDEYLGAVVPFIRQGVEGGEAVSVVTTPSNVSLLQEALGSEAEAVEFADHGRFDLTPARKVALLHGLREQATAAGKPGHRVVGEALFGATRREQLEWCRYEALLNVVFESAPQAFLCAYDWRELPDWLVETAGRTHPSLHDDGQRATSAAYGDPSELARELGRLLVPATPQDLGSPILDSGVDCGSLAKVRQMLLELAREVTGSAVRANDVALGLNEIVTNALEHGRQGVWVRCWRDAGRLACEVTDEGPGFDDPVAGFRPPALGQPGGRGLWLARQTLDAVELERGDPVGLRAHVTVEG